MRKLIVVVLLILVTASCGPRSFKAKWTKQQAPEYFKTRFETSQGDFELEVERRLSPKAADRFYQLVRRNYFKDALFYRVNPGFVAQFGTTDSIVASSWNAVEIPDEPVLQGNAKGTLSFGRSGPNTRGTELYINLADNHRLDTLQWSGVTGFPSFGRVTKGIEVLEILYSGYSDKTLDTLDLMYTNRHEFITLFPDLDRIKKAKIIN